MDNIFRGNNEQSHWEDKHEQSYGHFGESYESFCPENWESYLEADMGCTIALVKENHDAIKNKSFIDIGCAHGGILWYMKKHIIPDWEFTGTDFSVKMIEENKKKGSDMKIRLQEKETNYGIISCLQTIEHFSPGDNYKFLDNVLDHCEYLILATVDTEDDCFGEHISFYKLETMEEKGYDVVWKSTLGRVNSPTSGDFHTIIWLIKGNI